MPSTRQILTIGTAAVVLGVAGYAVYFDYARRTDPQFRKKLRQLPVQAPPKFGTEMTAGKEKKRIDRSNASLKASAAGASSEKQMPTDAELDAALQVVRNEDLPQTPEEKEQYFMQNLALGEQLSAQGLALPAALSFFRAMRVYPEPLQLVVILEKTLPGEMFRIVMDLMSRDVRTSPDAPASEKSGGSSARGSRTKRKGGNGSSSRGPPSEASSQEWDRVTEPDASISSLPSSNA